ncbi:MAG: 1,4-dihydroxy-6-naphthoate synthase [Nitrospirae bacterium]|nr:MAG: 1,4-dihydroxy-6-naphthoate synthase [Nitrospirota bacterium]
MNKKTITIGISPCPNDTFIFYGLLHQKVNLEGISLSPIIQDVEELNRLALKGIPDITKVSFHVVGHILEDYCLLPSGSALGRGCGPLLVADEPLVPEQLTGKRIGVPGRYTTAYLLMLLYNPGLSEQVVFMPFHLIMDEIKRGNIDAGLIIHEGRFTYQANGLHEIIDLGKWWEEETGMPIPLGGIVAKRSLGNELLEGISRAIQQSIIFSREHPEEACDFIQSNAQELSEDVQKRHIELYVNDFSLNMGKEGKTAVRTLLEMGSEKGILPTLKENIFCAV